MGETLMIKGVLTITKNLNMQVDDGGDSWFHTNNFRTRCTLGGKLCNIFIYGDSFENMIFNVMIDKLNLKCEKHPTPYHMSWINKGKEVTIDRRCLIKFLIKNTYKNKVQCDVISMDAYHILLGILWQFDKKVFHDGGKNSYTFWKDDVNVVLLLLKEEGQGQSLLMKKEFLTEAREVGWC